MSGVRDRIRNRSSLSSFLSVKLQPQTLSAHTMRADHFMFLPAGSWLLLASASQDKYVRIWAIRPAKEGKATHASGGEPPADDMNSLISRCFNSFCRSRGPCDPVAPFELPG